jgi:hypothetical protein
MRQTPLPNLKLIENKQFINSLRKAKDVIEIKRLIKISGFGSRLPGGAAFRAQAMPIGSDGRWVGMLDMGKVGKSMVHAALRRAQPPAQPAAM